MPERSYRFPDAAIDAEIDALVAEVADPVDPPLRRDYARQMVVTALRLLSDEIGTGDLKLLNAALKELRHAMRVFGPYAHLRKVAVFGSARTPAG